MNNLLAVVITSLGLAGQAPSSPSAPAPSSPPAPAPTAQLPAAPVLVAEGAWIRQPPPGAKMLGGYMRLKNPGPTPRKIVGVTTSLSSRAELHNHQNVDGVMKMRQVSVIEVPAGGEVVLQPGGLHLMVMQLQTTPKDGDTVSVVLQLEDGASVAMKVQVRREPPTPVVPATPVPASPSGW